MTSDCRAGTKETAPSAESPTACQIARWRFLGCLAMTIQRGKPLNCSQIIEPDFRSWPVWALHLPSRSGVEPIGSLQIHEVVQALERMGQATRLILKEHDP